MRKLIILLLIAVFIFPLVSAELKIKKLSSDEVLVAGLDKQVVFDLEITNLGTSDNFEFYNLLGFRMFPIGTVPINNGETKQIEMKLSPVGEFTYRGFYTLTYFIKGQINPEMKQEITFKVLDLEEIFDISSGEINLDSNTFDISITNKVNIDFDNVNVKFNSVFFDFEENFSLNKNGKKDFSKQLNKKDFENLIAGFYTLKADISVQEKKAELEAIIKFVESDLLVSTTKDYGFIINTKIIEKENQGNVLATSESIVKKSIISRLFTSFNPEPDIVDREGFEVYYTWTSKIKPGETLEIIVKTNWLFPLLVIVLIIVVVILAKQYSKTNLVLKKKVSFVKAKGGEFALKVSVIVQAKKYVEGVSIIDRLPALVKVYEKFGAEQPKRVDEKTRRIEWNFEKLEAGERRLLSYIIYSKVGVVGKFALPTTTGIYECNGKIHEVESNRVFFIAEQVGEEVEEE